MNINLGRWFEIIWQNKHYLKLDKAIDEYTNANWIHYWCILHHSELLQKIIEINPSLALVKDEFGNTPLHYLWQNTVSKFKEIKDMWECFKRNGAKQLAKNKQGLSWLDILDKRIKAANPYDEMAKYLKIVKE